MNQSVRVSIKHWNAKVGAKSRERESLAPYQSSDVLNSLFFFDRFSVRARECTGPTLVLIWAEDGYTICVGADKKWRDGGHFWGGEDATALLLGPEYRVLAMGTAEQSPILYLNTTIDGYKKVLFMPKVSC